MSQNLPQATLQYGHASKQRDLSALSDPQPVSDHLQVYSHLILTLYSHCRKSVPKQRQTRTCKI